MPPPIIVIGAGVLGLSTAIVLQQRLASTPIIIIAAELPTDPHPTADYASMWAGAHYRPIPRSTPQLQEEADLAMQTADEMKRIAKDYPEDEAGVKVMRGVEYLEAPTAEVLELKTGDLYAGVDDGFRILENEELPEGVKWGCEYQTYCVNVSVYCRWVMREFQRRGGRVIQYRLKDVREAFELAERMKLGMRGVTKVVNCSGRNFDQDSNMQIIRGQTVLVKQQYHETITRQNADGSWAFLIPRPGGGGTIMGGSKEVGDFETRVRPQTRKTLLQQAARYFPDFVESVEKLDIMQDNVGRRPWREGGLRIEIENLDSGQIIIHGYGAGGRGYELSWGAARKIADIAIVHLTQRSSL